MAEDLTDTQGQQRQYVWFVRYGLTEHPLVEDLGPYDSDIDPAEGIEHAKSIANRIAMGMANDTANSIPKTVYASPFLRTAHTGYIVANEIQQKLTTEVELLLEEGLWEWLIPSLLVTKCDGIKTNPRPLQELKEKLIELEGQGATIPVSYESVNPYDDTGDESITCVPPRQKNPNASPAIAGRRPRWIESENELLERCETTLRGILKQHTETGNSLCIVSHAPCDQSMAFALETDADTPKESKLKPWPLGGLTVFSRALRYKADGTVGGYGEWTLDMYGNTEHMPGEYKNGLKEWSLPCFSKC